MYVNSIQSSQSFGMALKIQEGARSSLEKASTKYLEKLKNVGKKIANHQHVDVILKDGTEPVVKTKFANAYKDFFKPLQPTDNILSVETRWAGPENYGAKYTACYKLASKEAAEEAYKKITSAYTTLEKAAEFAQVIEDNAILKTNSAIAENQKLAEQKALTNDLFKEFGVKE